MSGGYSEAMERAGKFTGPFLTGCSVYQLGMDEFVLKLNGKKLPEPKAEVDDSLLEIVIEGAQADKPEEVSSLAENFVEASPILQDFDLQNVSEDKVYKVVVHLSAQSPVTIMSALKTITGYTFRIRVQERQEEFHEPLLPLSSPNPAVIFPETSLPFSAEERTTIEFRDAELQDVFRLFMAALGRNIILDSSFPKNELVSMTLVDVRIDEIMNYLLRTYDIACYAYAPNITAFGTREALYKLSGAKQLKTFKISYASPQRIGELLKNLLGFSVTLIQDSTGSSSSSSSNTTSSTSTGSSVTASAVSSANSGTSSTPEVMIDQRLRTLYVKTNPARMQEVEELISMLDVPLSQVMIRASIFEFNDAATLDVETSLNMVYDRWTLESNNDGVNSLSYIDRTYSQGRSAFDRYITAAFSALESKNKGRTVANPSVITIEGEEAKITLKQDIMYSAGLDDNKNPTWNTTEVGPELTFTPIIEDKGYINLKIKINTGDYLGKDSDGNIITTDRNVETNIRVRDGMPFVVGGLFQDINTRLTTKFPILGDIPLIGNLFKQRSVDHDKTQAVMIVTPYILDSR